MAHLILILGDSGSGKSYSLRNYRDGKGIGYLPVNNKPLVIGKHSIPTFSVGSHKVLQDAIMASKAPVVVIDDFNYLITNEEFSRVGESGFKKFTDIAVNVMAALNTIINKPTDQRFYVMAHTDRSEDGHLRMKASGKVINEKFVPEGLTNQVIRAGHTGDRFVFAVESDGSGVKTPPGMFDSAVIDNDLKVVDDAIVEYYGIEDESKSKSK